jgi:hypothetical protein
MKRPLLLLAFASLTAACSVQTSSPPPPGPVVVTQGQAVIDWTIDGVKDPNKCAQSSVATIEITVTDTNGAPAGTFQQACSSFATTIALNAGAYSANASLLDSNGQPRTTSVPINPFTINGNDSLSIPIDFPASSFYGPT